MNTSASATASDDTWKAGRAEILTVICLSIVSLIVALDSTILVPVLPVSRCLPRSMRLLIFLQTLAVALNGSAIETFWAGTSFLLASSTFQPFIGALSDVFGRRELLLLSIFLFALGTLVACLSHGFAQFLAGRTIQGVGGGGITTLVLVICTDIIPLRQRPKFTSFMQISWALGTVSGPLIGAAFAEYVSWRWMYGFIYFVHTAELHADPLAFTLISPSAASAVSWPSWSFASRNVIDPGRPSFPKSTGPVGFCSSAARRHSSWASPGEAFNTHGAAIKRCFPFYSALLASWRLCSGKFDTQKIPLFAKLFSIIFPICRHTYVPFF